MDTNTAKGGIVQCFEALLAFFECRLGLFALCDVSCGADNAGR